MNGDRVRTRQDVIADIWGGLASMLVAIPSAIAFGVTIYAPLGGSLAAQGAMAGILGATALGLIAPAFGGSTRLITSPCAPAAAVLSALVLQFVHQGIAAGAVLLMLALIGLLCGLFQIGLGLLGVGRLIKYVPYPVVSGYLSGVGLLIIGSQIPKFLGAGHGLGLIGAIQDPSNWSWQSVIVGAVVIAAMVMTPRLTKAIPAAIVALASGMGMYFLLAGMDFAPFSPDHNPLLIGTFPSSDVGFGESLRLRWASLHALGANGVINVLIPALTLAALLSIDTLKTCLVVDSMTNSHHESNKELRGQGLANLASAVIGGVPGSGTMGGTMVNIASGGTSKLSGMMSGLFSLAAYFILSPMISWIPVSALAAILIVIGFRMIDRHSLAFFFSASTRLDFVVILAVILVAIFGDLIAASGTGVAFAMLLFVREQIRGSIVHHRLDGHDIFTHRILPQDIRDRLDHQGDQVVEFELQGSLFFGTASQLYAALEPEIETRKYVILNLRRVHSLDVTATHVLEQIKDRLEEKGGYLIFCEIPKGLPSGLKMKKFLKETGVVRQSDKALSFRQIDDALDWVEEQLIGGEVGLDPSKELELAEMPLFSGCSQAELESLQNALRLETIKADKKLFKPDDDGDDLFLIRQGLVKVSLAVSKKETYHFATCGPGELIGGMGFLENMHHYAEAETLTDVTVYVLSREQFEALAKSHGHLALRIVSSLGRSLSNRLRFAIKELHALRV